MEGSCDVLTAACLEARPSPRQHSLRALAPSGRWVCALTFGLCSLNNDLSGFQIRRLKGLSVCVASGVVSIYKYFNRTFIPSNKYLRDLCAMSIFLVFFNKAHLKGEKKRVQENCHHFKSP